MKLLSFIHQGRETWGAVVGDGVVDLGATRSGQPTLADYIASGDYLQAAEHVKALKPVAKLAEITYLPVIPRPEKIVCAVRNYMDHHKEVLAAGMQRELSEFPPIFLRVWRSQVAHGQPIIRPRVSESLDWEGELAVIIGKGGRDIAEADVAAHIAGYACYNDGSVRDYQRHSPQFTAGKNFHASGAFGPWLVTSDEIPDPRKLQLTTRLNGAVMQHESVGELCFDVPQLIEYCSTFAQLEPGDAIVTGTPGGVGAGRKPPVWMKPGDTVEVEVSGIGTLRNPVRREQA